MAVSGCACEDDALLNTVARNEYHQKKSQLREALIPAS
jgi:hypothetical protein